MSLVRCYTWVERKLKTNKFLGTDPSFEVRVPNVTSPEYFIADLRCASEEFPVVEVDLPPEIGRVHDGDILVSRMWFTVVGDRRVRLFSTQDYFEWLAENTKENIKVVEVKATSWSEHLVPADVDWRVM